MKEARRQPVHVAKARSAMEIELALGITARDKEAALAALGESGVEKNYRQLLTEVMTVVLREKMLQIPIPDDADQVMVVKDHPKYRYERWTIGVHPLVSDGREKQLSLGQMIWSPTFGRFVEGEKVVLGIMTYDGDKISVDGECLEWIEENPDECRAIVNFLRVAEPEE